jgi:hypothetical protein
LDEVSHGHEDLDPRAIRKQVVEAIHQAAGNSYREIGMLPTRAVADLLLEVCRNRDPRPAGTAGQSREKD